MLAAPASTAAPPRAKSRVSWNPAVPPPPAAGAAAGTRLADGLGVSEGLALALAELLDEEAGVGEVDPAGENEVGTDEGVDPVQAETAAEASMVMALQPMTANLALSPVPAMAVRIFMEPPHAPREVAALFPGPGTGNRPPEAKRDPAAAAPAAARSPETATAIKARPTDGIGTRWPDHPGISGYGSGAPWGRRRVRRH
jgi:hypothetical protein